MQYGSLPLGAVVAGRKVVNRMPGIIINCRQHVRLTFSDGTGDVYPAAAMVPVPVHGELLPAGPVKPQVAGRTARRLPNGATPRERVYVWR